MSANALAFFHRLIQHDRGDIHRAAGPVRQSAVVAFRSARLIGLVAITVTGLVHPGTPEGREVLGLGPTPSTRGADWRERYRCVIDNGHERHRTS
jgi:hypothetical protein